MGEALASLNGVEVFFLVCAIAGGLFVVFRLVMLAFGLGHDGAGDMGGHDGADFSGGHGGSGVDSDAHDGDSDSAFKILSIQTLSSFLLMFGLVGFAMYRENAVGTVFSLLGGIVAGLVSVWILGKLFALAIRLQSSGTIPTDATVGAQGEVYLAIPKDGTGRVLVRVRNCLREYDACSQDKEDIPTGTPIRVVWTEGNVLMVEKI